TCFLPQARSPAASFISAHTLLVASQCPTHPGAVSPRLRGGPGGAKRSAADWDNAVGLSLADCPQVCTCDERVRRRTGVHTQSGRLASAGRRRAKSRHNPHSVRVSTRRGDQTFSLRSLLNSSDSNVAPRAVIRAFLSSTLASSVG